MFTFDKAQMLAILYIFIPNKNEFEIFKILSIKKNMFRKKVFFFFFINIRKSFTAEQIIAPK